MRYIVLLSSGDEKVVEAAQAGIEDSGVLRFYDDRAATVAAFGRNHWVCFTKEPK